MLERRPSSLRAQLLAWLLLPLSAVVVFNVWTSHQSALETADLINDRTLLASARVISEQVQDTDGHLEALIPPAALEMFVSNYVERVIYSVTSASGVLIAGHPDVAAPPKRPEGFEPIYYNAVFRGQPIRAVVLSQPVASLAGFGPAVVVVADTLNSRDALVAKLWLKALRDQVLLVAVVCLLALFGLNRALRPVARLRDMIKNHDPASLDRLPDRNISPELRPLVQSLNEAFARSERYLASQRRFVANASHQLRTPLAVLKTQAHLGLSESEPEAKNEVLRGIGAGVERLTRVANQLLTLARVEPGGLNMRKAELDFAGLTRSVLERMAVLALEHGLELEFACADTPIPVYGHETLLRELVANLVENAIRYTPSPGSVLVTVWQEDQNAKLKVEDTGPGIPSSERERVFERFYRRLGSGVEGTGLGLAIVREIVDAHSGKITLADRDPQPGLQSLVTFPLARG